MPAGSSSSKLTVEGQAKERERNRRKQQRYRDRQKQARLQQNQGPDDSADKPDEGHAAADDELTRDLAPVKRTRATASALSAGGPPADSVESNAVQRMSTKLVELGVDQHEIERLISGAGAGADEVNALASSGCELTVAPQNTVIHSQVDIAIPTQLSTSPALAPPSAFELTPTSLFAGLLNDALPPPRLSLSLSHPFPPTPDSPPPTLDLLRRALGLSPEPQRPRQLPSYTFNSPVSFETDGRPVDWKVTLFALHATCHAQRHHPTEGYLHNEAVRKIMVLAQTAILQLRGPHFRPYAGEPAFPEYLAPEDEALLARLEDDPRFAQCNHKKHKLQVVKAINNHTLDPTEFIGNCIEGARFHTDPWDMAPCSFPASFLASLPPALQQMVVHATPADVQYKTHGASMREIVLGLDLPSWRATVPDPGKNSQQHRLMMKEANEPWVGIGAVGVV